MALPVVAAGALWTALRYVLVTVLLMLVEPILSRILLALGVGFVSYTGIGALLEGLYGKLSGTLSGVPADILAILALAGFGNAMTILLSACTIRMTLNGLSAAGSIVKSKLGKK